MKKILILILGMFLLFGGNIFANNFENKYLLKEYIFVEGEMKDSITDIGYYVLDSNKKTNLLLYGKNKTYYLGFYKKDDNNILKGGAYDETYSGKYSPDGNYFIHLSKNNGKIIIFENGNGIYTEYLDILYVGYKLNSKTNISNLDYKKMAFIVKKDGKYFLVEKINNEKIVKYNKKYKKEIEEIFNFPNIIFRDKFLKTNLGKKIQSKIKKLSDRKIKILFNKLEKIDISKEKYKKYYKILKIIKENIFYEMYLRELLD